MNDRDRSQGAQVRFVLFAAATTALGGFLFGYDSVVINGANTYLKSYLGLNATQEGLTGASAIMGCIPGAMCSGFLSDRFGRRKLLFLCALLYAVSGVLSAIPHSFEQFLAARFLSGLGVGASSMICPVYIAEISPKIWRGRLGMLFQLSNVVGDVAALFGNKLIHSLGNEAWNIAYGWRWMLGTETLPAIPFFLLLLAVPESPRWLAQKGRLSEARDILGKLGGPEHAAAELAAIRAADQQETGRFSELFTGVFRKAMLVAVLLCLFNQLTGINAVIYYSTKIFESAGGTQSAAFTSSVWVGLINLAFTLVAISLVDKAGRRPLLLIGSVLQTVALAAVGWMFYTGRSGPALLWCINLFIAAYAIGPGAVCWLYCSEIFPNKVRGRAMSVSAFTIWTSCFVVAQTFPMLNENPAIGPAKTFWIYAGISLVSLLFVATMVPETKGRTLEQIEEIWSRKGRGHSGSR